MEVTILKRLLIGAVVFALLSCIVTRDVTVCKVTAGIVVVLFPLGVAWHINEAGSAAEIERFREKIRGYRPYKWTAKDGDDGFEKPSKVRLGVFGVQGSGKSSFLNSLHFAFKDSWEQVYVEKGEASDGGETIFRDPAKLSHYVTTFDTRGLVDLSNKRVPDVIAEITGKRGINTRSKTTGEKIDCPIFILKYNIATGMQHIKRFLETLVPKFKEQLGGYPITVVTFANSISNQKEILGEITGTGMEKGSVFFIENYTAENHEIDSKKHIDLLKILEACIKRADDNIVFRWRTENEIPEENRCETIIGRFREKIRDYRPGQWTTKDAGPGFQRPSKVRLGVFGVQDSGKSSFLNSLHYAFKGDWEQVYVEKGEASVGGETTFRDPSTLSDHVTTFDTRGLVDLADCRVPDVIAEITGKRGINTRSNTTGEKIDCPIFIQRYSTVTGTRHCTAFLEALVSEVREHLGGYPIMVVTFAKSIFNQEEILGEITRAGMAKGSVFFIENYTAENHEMDSEKHIALLEILEACIKRADDNIVFRWRTEHERPERRGLWSSIRSKARFNAGPRV